jgi:hypothetical protein
MDIYITRHFTLTQLTRTREAVINGIDNTPGAEELIALTHLVINLLEPLRMKLNQHIYIISGYRTERLNYILENRRQSLYTRGEAVSIGVSGRVEDIQPVLIRYEIPFHKCIIHRQLRYAEIAYKKNGNNLHQLIYK